MIKQVETPYTKLQKEYEAKLADKDSEIKELKKKIAGVRGINDLLKFELIELDRSLTQSVTNLSEAMQHVRNLKLNLPELEKYDDENP